MENIEEVYEWPIHKLWNAFNSIARDDPEYAQEYTDVKNGIKIKFPIHYIIEEWYNVYPRSNNATIEGHGIIPLNNFIDEKELRTIIMQDIIIKEFDNPKITEPRIQ